MLTVSAGTSARATSSESRDAAPEAPQSPLISVEVCGVPYQTDSGMVDTVTTSRKDADGSSAVNS
jgi:predicted naringenin-chalcone synthase